MNKKHYEFFVENYKTAEFVDISVIPSIGMYFTYNRKTIGIRIGWIIWELHFVFVKT